MPIDDIAPSLTAPPCTLTEQTMDTLRTFFASRQHRPSREHWDALRDVAGTMQAMADGTCDPKVFLSAIDPGVGKTQTVIHFARALMSSAEHRHVGMVVCVGRIAEACSLAEAFAEHHRQHVAVRTADDKANAMSGAAPEQAQVLITTQQAIERSTEHCSFGAVARFHFKDAPRRVRVWDEAWLPGVAVTLSSDDLFQIIKPLRRLSARLADGLQELALRLSHAEAEQTFTVPDFSAAYGVSVYEALATLTGTTGSLRDDYQIVGTALTALQGRTGRVVRDGKTGVAVLTYRDTLPDDLAPLLVLDASGRVRETYRHIERHRGSLTRLKEAVKDYSPLTIYGWTASGSKSSFSSNGDVLAQGIAETIKTKPFEKWLVVAHKPRGRIKDLEKQLRRQMSSKVMDNVSVITWGQHMATNDYVDVPNVILAGTLFFKQSFYTALTHLAQDRSVVPGLAPVEDIKRTMRGEHANLILQALCRGRVRKSNDAQCWPMTAYVIACRRSGIPDQLTTIFPGCTVKPWNPVTKPAKGKLKAAETFIRREIFKGADTIPYRDIQEAIGVSRKNFGMRVTKRPEWPSIMDRLGVEPYGSPKRPLGIRRCGSDGDRIAA